MSPGAAALWGALGASSLLVGAGAAMTCRLSTRTVGLVMGFGAGTLISAISYELVGEPADAGWRTAVGLGIGAATFFVGDWLVDRGGGGDRKRIAGAPSDASAGMAILLGTLLDGVPESVILGTSLALGGSVSLAFLAAVFISNLPEAVAATASMQTAGTPRARILGIWLCLVAASAVAAALGWLLASRQSAVDGVLVQTFAAGAMLTMLADTMMPEAFVHGGRVVGLVTVLGFMLATGLSAVQ